MPWSACSVKTASLMREKNSSPTAGVQHAEKRLLLDVAGCHMRLCLHLIIDGRLVKLRVGVYLQLNCAKRSFKFREPQNTRI